MIFKSQYPDLDIPTTNVLDYLFPQDQEASDEPLWIESANTSHFLSPRAAVQWVKRLGYGMQRLGIQKDDVCVIFTPNHIYVPVAYLAFVGYGAAFSGLNPAYTLQETVFQLKNTNAKLLFVHPDLIEMGIKAAAQAGIPKDHVYLFSEKYHTTIDGVKDWREMVGTESEGQEWKWRSLSPEESKSQVATVNYSSGTTGLPKGVLITHHNLISNTLQLSSSTTFFPSERWVGFLPLYHAYGQTFMILIALTHHIPVFIMKAFDFVSYLQIIEKQRITRLQTVPPILVMLAKRKEVGMFDLGCVREILCGAAKCGRELVEEVRRKFGLGVVQGWGSTETTCAVCFYREGRGIPSGSVGMILPNTEIMLVDDDGREVGLNTPGEAYVRGPQMALGYWQNEEASRDSFEADGWYKTGDVVVADEKGFFYIVDRKKEMIKVNALQVAPSELEMVLIENECVADAAVSGVTVFGEEWPRAYIVLVPEFEGKLTEKGIQKWIEPRVAKHKRLRGGVAFVDEIPRLESGKITRKIMKEWAKRDSKKLESMGGVKAKL